MPALSPASKAVITAALLLIIASAFNAHAFLGMELGPMLQLVAGQVKEIEQLTTQVGVARDNYNLLNQVNQGIERTVQQIQSIQTIIERAQGLDPKAVRSVSELNDFLARVQEAKRAVDEVVGIRLEAARFAVSQSALQSENAYLMGQEMIATGSNLATESQNASPGRAQQISAASSSAQMLSQGVELQTLAQIAQLQAMQLELQRAQMEQLLEERKANRVFFETQLAQGDSRRAPKVHGGIRP